MKSHLLFALRAFCTYSLCIASSTAADNSVSDSSDISKYYGLIVTRKYFGPPNYDSTSKLEKVKALLIKSSDSQLKPNLVQLYISLEKRALYDCAKSGCRAYISGRLFEAESGHHHTAQILEVTKIELEAACITSQRGACSATTPNHSAHRTYCGMPAFGLQKPSRNTSLSQ